MLALERRNLILEKLQAEKRVVVSELSQLYNVSEETIRRDLDKLEKEGRGLNLTWEVRNGIITHTKGAWAATLEGQAVRYADRIAYINHGIVDIVIDIRYSVGELYYRALKS